MSTTFVALPRYVLSIGTVHSFFQSKCSTEWYLVPLSSSIYLISSPMSSSSCVRFLPRLTILPIFPSITCFRRQFLHNMWPVQLAFFSSVLCGMFLFTLNLCNTFSFFHPFSALHFRSCQVLLVSEVSRCQQHPTLCSICSTSLISFFFISSLPVKKKTPLFLLNATFAIAVLDLTSSEYVASFAIRLSRCWI